MCSVRPASRSSAWGSSGRIAASELFAPAGLPGRLTISVAAQRPADGPAQRSQRRVPQPLGTHPLGHSIDQPVTDQPGRLGVTSRAASPVPPVVTINLRSSHDAAKPRQSAPLRRARSPASTTRHPQTRATGAPPDPRRRPARPWKQRSLIVSTTARTFCRESLAHLSSLRVRLAVPETRSNSSLRNRPQK